MVSPPARGIPVATYVVTYIGSDNVEAGPRGAVASSSWLPRDPYRAYAIVGAHRLAGRS